jgi:hypothetical protein
VRPVEVVTTREPSGLNAAVGLSCPRPRSTAVDR